MSDKPLTQKDIEEQAKKETEEKAKKETEEKSEEKTSGYPPVKKSSSNL